MDSVTILRHWRTLLKENGRLIIAVPNNAIHKSIPMNVEHVHGFDPTSMKSLLEVCGYRVIEQLDGGNTISFITIAERI
jgi:predicted SAM-dependent methyltransferase